MSEASAPSPAHQEDAEPGEQESDEHTDPGVGGERCQQAEAALLRGHVFTHDEAEPRLHEGRGHVHVLLSDGGEGQRGHGQVGLLVEDTTPG